MALPHKHPKTGMYWFRKRVPDDLRERIGKKFLYKTLETKDLEEAKSRYLKLAHEVDEEWRSIRRGTDWLPTPSLERLIQKQVVGITGELYRWLAAQHSEDPGDSKR